MKIVYHPRCLGYSAPGHPESPERILRALPLLSRHYQLITPEPAREEQLLKIHTPDHVRRIKSLDFYDPDCPRYDQIFEIASLAAGGAILAAQIGGFSLMRPPGHHASRERPAGFCYFNNVAVAVKCSNKKTLIIDIDGHHGDGTQAIFLGDLDIRFISLHSSPNYPGTGLRSEQNCINVPLAHYCGDEIYLAALDGAIGQVDLDSLESVAVSAGFDAFKLDPLASLGLTTGCYEKIGRRIAELGLPVFGLLEGGYDVEHLGENIHRFLQGLQAGSVV